MMKEFPSEENCFVHFFQTKQAPTAAQETGSQLNQDQKKPQTTFDDELKVGERLFYQQKQKLSGKKTLFVQVLAAAVFFAISAAKPKSPSFWQHAPQFFPVCFGIAAQ